MIAPLLKLALESVVLRHRRMRARLALAAAWFCAAALGAILLAARAPGWKSMLMLLTAVAAGWIFSRRRAARWAPDYVSLAGEIEQRHPELHALLRTAVEQRPAAGAARLDFLQERLVAQAVAECRRSQWIDSVPPGRWRGAQAAVGLSLLACGTVLVLLMREPRARAATRDASSEAVTVTPGDVQLERGSGLVVLARFPREVPTEAVLVVQPRNGATQRISLVRNLADPVFGSGLPTVDADLAYRVEYAGHATRDYHVRVYEHPRLERADATLQFPPYTKLPEKKIADTRRISAVEGTTLQAAFGLNKPVQSAQLVAQDGTTVPLSVMPGRPGAELRDFPVAATKSYQLRLVDEEGRLNKDGAQFTIEALPNRLPEVKVAAPKGDCQVSPLEEVAFRGEVWDEFGLARYGLSYTVAGRAPQEVELGRDTAPDERRTLNHLLKLEDLGVKADQLISWHFWAEDAGPDGQPRRTASDLHFAEVRPFEEIFRQGQGEEGSAPPGQGSAAEKLAELQKQVMVATWKLQQAAKGGEKPPPKYLQDAPVVRDSQAEAVRQATGLLQEMESAKAKGFAEQAAREMKVALDRLDEAAASTRTLPAALEAEQAAYDALLKLAAHEHRVVQQKGKGGAAGQQRKQQQLDQLEMKEEGKRYETKSEAEPPQQEQQREQLAVLSRLKELAQRQNDLIEKARGLQTALQEAKTEPQREDFRQQLKRLRDDEQQTLADLDELRQKLGQSAQQAQLADERKKLDEARDEAQQTSEALKNLEASAAVASGTRAARHLQELRDDFRKKASGQFHDEMRELRAATRELAGREQEVAGQLQEPAGAVRPSLDSDPAQQKLADNLARQSEDLARVAKKMKQVSEAAEASEPLLSKELYDTLRKNAQADPGDALAQAGQLVQRGNAPQARPFEEKARRAIDELAGGVERAAEGVLGGEAEALQKARAELDALSGPLERELAAARPDLAADRSPATAPPETAADSTIPDPSSPDGHGKAGAGQYPAPESGDPRGASGKQAQRAPDQAAAGPGQSGAGAKDGAESAEAQSGPGGKAGENSAGAGNSTAKNGQAPARGGDGHPTPAEGGAKAGVGGKGALAGNPGSPARAGAAGAGGEGGGGGRQGGAWRGEGPAAVDRPLTGEKFTDWSDRLRNVEEMLDDPGLRSDAARVREVAKGMRAEYKVHGTQPDWDMVRMKISRPLAELRSRLSEELARRESRENLVPIDRDPVPAQYVERVQRYYENLGRSR